jgi:uncharacterized DUF497 family protein
MPDRHGVSFEDQRDLEKDIRHVHVTRQTPTKVKGIYVSHEHKVNDSLTIISKR